VGGRCSRGCGDGGFGLMFLVSVRLVSTFLLQTGKDIIYKQERRKTFYDLEVHFSFSRASIVSFVKPRDQNWFGSSDWRLAMCKRRETGETDPPMLS